MNAPFFFSLSLLAFFLDHRSSSSLLVPPDDSILFLLPFLPLSSLSVRLTRFALVQTRFSSPFFLFFSAFFFFFFLLTVRDCTFSAVWTPTTLGREYYRHCQVHFCLHSPRSTTPRLGENAPRGFFSRVRSASKSANFFGEKELLISIDLFATIFPINRSFLLRIIWKSIYP